MGGWATLNSYGDFEASTGNPGAAATYTTFPTGASSSTVNYSIAATTTPGQSDSINSLKFLTTSSVIALGANNLTVTSGGLLVAGNICAHDLLEHRRLERPDSGVDLITIVGNSSANFTISAIIADNTGDCPDEVRSRHTDLERQQYLHGQRHLPERKRAIALGNAGAFNSTTPNVLGFYNNWSSTRGR